MKSLLLLLLCSLTALAGPIDGPKEFKRDTIAEFKVKAKGSLDYDLPKGLSVKERPGEWLIAGAPGTYKFSVIDFWVDFDAKKQGIDKSIVEFTILPSEVDPEPPPTPPTPDPSVRTNPFSDDTARVLIMWDSSIPLTSAQRDAMYSEESRKAYEAFGTYWICPKGQTSGNQVWSAAIAKVKSFPWVMVGKGSKGDSRALNSAADLKAALAAASVTQASPYWSVGGQNFYTAPACTPIHDRFGRVVGYSNCP